MKILRYLVTGGSGFIGSHIVEELIKTDNFVRIFDINCPNIKLSDRVEFIEGDISNEKILDEVFSGIDIVYHTCWTTIPKTSNSNIKFDISSNLISTINILDKCVKYGVNKIIFTSSGGTVYGDVDDNPIKETHPTEPICSYGIAKLAVEKYLQLYYNLYDLDYIILRCSNPFGERQNYLKNQGLLATMMYKIVSKEPFHVWGNGEVVRDYIYIKDLVNAHIKVASYKGKEKVFNIGSGIGLSINDVIEKVKDVLDINFDVVYEKSRNCDVDKNILNIERAKSELNWFVNEGIDEGIRNTWKWINEKMNC